MGRIMAVDISYISDFLNRGFVEGPRNTVGYIPCWIAGTDRKKSANYFGKFDQSPSRYEAMGASGVTIATGCDLGQTDIPSLKNYGVSDALISKLSPYIGLKKSQAIAKLHEQQLRISEDEAAELDHCVHGGYLKRYVEPAYNKASSVAFADLPKQAQAVVFSVCFQKGCGGVRRDWPKLWGYLTTQDWKNAAHELRTGFKQYVGRRKVEASVLEELL